MNFFGIGTSEFIIIFLLALIFLGPQRLPQYANKLGQKIREWRMMSQVFMVEWKEELAALEEARQSLAEARAAVLEAQQTVTSEVKEVSQTVSTEMTGTQRDISAQLSDAEKVVSDETAQVRNTMNKMKKGDVTPDTAESSAVEKVTPAASDGDISGVDASDVDVVSDVEELDEDDLSDVVENTIAPPALVKQTQVSRITESDEIDVTEIQTVSDVASDVAEKIATEVATQVAHKITKNMTSNMAEEVVALVMAKLAKAGITGDVGADTGQHPEDNDDVQDTLESIPTQSESSELQEVLNE